MALRRIDQQALHIPQRSRLPLCLYIPIAARSPSAIEAYVGKLTLRLAPRSPRQAFLVKADEAAAPDSRLAIWSHPSASVLHTSLQVWVHVDYRDYRKAYQRAFPDAELQEIVLDHVMNRRLARLKGFDYLRIVPVSNKVNSSHGGLSERWAVNIHKTPGMRVLHKSSRASVQYADLADIVKMLNMEGGGSRMNNVNAAQALVNLPRPTDG